MSIADKIKALAKVDPKIAAINAERVRLKSLTDTVIEQLIAAAMAADPEKPEWVTQQGQMAMLCKKLSYLTKSLEESYAIDRREEEAIEDAKRLFKVAKYVKMTTWQGKKIPHA